MTSLEINGKDQILPINLLSNNVSSSGEKKTIFLEWINP